MKVFKKIFIFLAIIVLTNSIIYVYPIHKLLSIYNLEQNNITLDSNVNPSYGHITNILNSYIASEYKGDAMSILVSDHNTRNVQRNTFYKILLYCAVIITIVIAILGHFLMKLYQDKKYIGTAFIFSSILSILLLILFYYALYMTQQ